MAPPPGSPPAEPGSGRAVALVAISAVAIGLLALLLLRREPPPAPSPREALAPASAARTARPRSAGGPARITYDSYGLPQPTDSHPDDADQPCGLACACTSTDDPCKAGRLCTAHGCDEPLEGRPWRLRFGGLSVAMEPPGGLDGDTAVCVLKAGGRDATCTTLKEQHAKNCARGTGLPVTTEQLTGDGLDVEVRDPRGKVVARAEKVAYASLSQRDICLGVRFGGGKFKGPLAIDKVTFWLDEP